MMTLCKYKRASFFVTETMSYQTNTHTLTSYSILGKPSAHTKLWCEVMKLDLHAHALLDPVDRLSSAMSF